MRFSPLLTALTFSLLWLQLGCHLSVDWETNPQYAYGWAVPFLTIFLLINARANRRGLTPMRSRSLHASLRLFLLLVWLPLRLLQVANPEWRLLSWIIALLLLALTLEFAVALPESSGPVWLQRAAAAIGNQPLALGFILLAIPWPTALEATLLQALSRFTTMATGELLNLVGTPALAHGNVIQLAGVQLGIEEACTGIRSFQAVVMLSAFFALLYAPGYVRALLLLGIGLTLSLALNVARTTLLSLVAVGYGSAALEGWHDPLGVAILLVCFLTLWWTARCLSLQRHRSESTDAPQPRADTFVPIRKSPSLLVPAWFGVAQIIVVLWYSPPPLSQSAGTSPPWDTALRHLAESNPAARGPVRRLPVSATTTQILRCSSATTLAWQKAHGEQIQVTDIRWAPGRAAAHLARSHSPDICLPSAGYQLTGEPHVEHLLVGETRVPFRTARFATPRGAAWVFWVVWDHTLGPQPNPGTLDYSSRIRAVLSRRSPAAQASLQVIVEGVDDLAPAMRLAEEALLQR